MLTHFAETRPSVWTYGVDGAPSLDQLTGPPGTGCEERVYQTLSSGTQPSAPGRAGLTQPTVIPGWSATPNNAPTGGTLFSRKLVQLITQPVCPSRLHSGVFLKVPPTKFPCGTMTLKPGRMASFIRAANA